MILALDVGNTNIVFGGIDGEKIYFESRLSTDRHKTETEYAVLFKNILDIHGIALDQLDGAIISAVVPPLTKILKRALMLVTGFDPIEVTAKMDLTLQYAVDNHDQVGSDIIVGAVAAMDKYPLPLILFDLGTATTISVLDAKGVFLGMSILPGIRISQDALAAGTSLLPHIEYDYHGSVIGTNTVDCMKSGLIYGNASMMDGMIARIEEELGGPATVVATGGLAKAVTPYCRREVILDDNLLLKGLWLIYAQHMKKV